MKKSILCMIVVLFFSASCIKKAEENKLKKNLEKQFVIAYEEEGLTKEVVQYGTIDTIEYVLWKYDDFYALSIDQFPSEQQLMKIQQMYPDAPMEFRYDDTVLDKFSILLPDADIYYIKEVLSE